MSVEQWPMLISFGQPLRRSSVLACSLHEFTFLPSRGTPPWKTLRAWLHTFRALVFLPRWWDPSCRSFLNGGKELPFLMKTPKAAGCQGSVSPSCPDPRTHWSSRVDC